MRLFRLFKTVFLNSALFSVSAKNCPIVTYLSIGHFDNHCSQFVGTEDGRSVHWIKSTSWRYTISYIDDMTSIILYDQNAFPPESTLIQIRLTQKSLCFWLCRTSTAAMPFQTYYGASMLCLLCVSDTLHILPSSSIIQGLCKLFKLLNCLSKVKVLKWVSNNLPVGKTWQHFAKKKNQN